MKKIEEKEAIENSTKESVENGQKAIDMNLALNSSEDPKAEEKEHKDREAWRNEG